MLSPPGVSVEPDTSNPPGGQEVSPPPPALGLPLLLGVGGLRARLSATEMLQKEELRRVGHGGRSCMGGGGGQSSEFPGSVWPFPSGKVQEIRAGSPITASYQPVSGHTSRSQRPELQRIGTLP